jgi:Pyruvate/2-oxoacid:ferredoxin oxidoreductase gamma subunit
MIKKEFARKAKFIPANVAAFEAGYDKGHELRGES